jgi:peptidoglycan hydrolase FlgJ
MDSKIDPSLMLSQAMAQTPKNAPGRDPQKIKEATQQFEAIYIQQMFKEMRNSVPDGGLIERDNANDIYTQLQDAEAAKVMSEQGGIGLSDLMLQQLLGEDEK